MNRSWWAVLPLMAVIASLLVPSSAKTEAETSSSTTFPATNLMLGGIELAREESIPNQDLQIARHARAVSMLRRARHHRFVVHKRWVAHQRALKAKKAAAAEQQRLAQASAVPQSTSSAGGSPGGNLQGIAQCESGGNPGAVSPDGQYRGKYQFSQATWEAIGGTGDPAAAPEGVQDAMADKLYKQAGAGQWPVCGR